MTADDVAFTNAVRASAMRREWDAVFEALQSRTGLCMHDVVVPPLHIGDGQVSSLLHAALLTRQWHMLPRLLAAECYSRVNLLAETAASGDEEGFLELLQSDVASTHGWFSDRSAHQVLRAAITGGHVALFTRTAELAGVTEMYAHLLAAIDARQVASVQHLIAMDVHSVTILQERDWTAASRALIGLAAAPVDTAMQRDSIRIYELVLAATGVDSIAALQPPALLGTPPMSSPSALAQIIAVGAVCGHALWMLRTALNACLEDNDRPSSEVWAGIGKMRLDCTAHEVYIPDPLRLRSRDACSCRSEACFCTGLRQAVAGDVLATVTRAFDAGVLTKSIERAKIPRYERKVLRVWLELFELSFMSFTRGAAGRSATLQQWAFTRRRAAVVARAAGLSRAHARR